MKEYIRGSSEVFFPFPFALEEIYPYNTCEKRNFKRVHAHLRIVHSGNGDLIDHSQIGMK